tara:strand:+ start:147 stop:425 length:279 start_codon:yes stop_codon:yes gene_type:complete
MIEKEKFIEYLDSKTCDTVLEDVQQCVDDWSLKELDSRSAMITLARFAVNLTFKFSYTQKEALELILSMVHDHMDLPGYEPSKEEDPKQIIH